MQPFKPQTTPQYHGTNPGAPTVGHETKDVNVRAILGFLMALAVCGLAVFAICFGIFNAFNSYVTKHDGASATWNADQDRAEAARVQQLRKEGANETQMEQSTYEMHVERFPQPRLQTDDVRDLQMLRDQEDLQLDNYMWLDKSTGKVGIPIDRAIDLVAERGLPAVPNAQPVSMTEPYTLGVTRVSRTSSHTAKF